MAIRPVEFQGMIQNTQEISQNRNTEQQRPMIQQDQVANQNQQQVQLARSQVSESEQSEKNNMADNGGDGTGYEGNRGNKREKKEKKKVSEGMVRIKNAPKSFDASV